MLVTTLRWAYRRLGRHYPRVFLVLELQTVYPVILGTYALFSFYYDGSTGEFFTLFGITCALAAIAIVIACFRTFPMLRPLELWIAGARDERSTTEAWAAAVSFPWRMIRSNVFVPATHRRWSRQRSPRSSCWTSAGRRCSHSSPVPPLPSRTRRCSTTSRSRRDAAGPGGHQPADLAADGRRTSRRSRCAGGCSLTLPLINADHRPGRRRAHLGRRRRCTSGSTCDRRRRRDHDLARADPASKSILRPLADLQQATERDRRGRLRRRRAGDHRRRDWASSRLRSTQMVQGLAERERIREAFGTYLDKEVAEYILSDGFSEEGRELEVSILFCDVRDFTGFAAGAEREGGRRLPQRALRGGRARDLAPRRPRRQVRGRRAARGLRRPGAATADHAKRATRAALEIGRRRQRATARPASFAIGVGVNTGRVVAGSIGGGGPAQLQRHRRRGQRRGAGRGGDPRARATTSCITEATARRAVRGRRARASAASTS